MDERSFSQRKRGSQLSWLSSTSSLQARPYADYDYQSYEDDSIGFVPAGAASNTATPTPTSGSTPPAMSMAVLTLIIVASLSAVVGAIYLLIYFKSIKPMSARSRSYADPSGGKGDDDGGRKSAGHPFFRRK